MIDPIQEIITAGVYSVIFAFIFSLSRLVLVFLPDQKEFARKTAHFLAGITAISFPYYIKSPWTVGILCVLFLLILFLGRRHSLLAGIHGVERKSIGAYFFPVAVCLLFIFGQNQPVFYMVSVLVLSISDTAAALVGTRYGSIKFELDGNLKSLEGTLSFILMTFLCTQIPLLLLTDMDKLQVILISFIVAVIVAGFELISLSGTDNLFIPIGTYYIISRISSYPMAVTYQTVTQLFFSVFLVLLIFGALKSIKASWKIALMLFNFALFTLSIYTWYLPAIVFQALLALLLYVYTSHHGKVDFKLREALYIAVPLAAILFVMAITNDFNQYYYIFLTALVLELTLLARELLPEIFHERFSGKVSKVFLHAGILAVSLGLVAFLAILVFDWGSGLKGILIVGGSVLVGYLAYPFLKLLTEKTRDLKEKGRGAAFIAKLICLVITLGLTLLGKILWV